MCKQGSCSVNILVSVSMEGLTPPNYPHTTPEWPHTTPKHGLLLETQREPICLPHSHIHSQRPPSFCSFWARELAPHTHPCSRSSCVSECASPCTAELACRLFAQSFLYQHQHSHQSHWPVPCAASPRLLLPACLSYPRLHFSTSITTLRASCPPAWPPRSTSEG